MLVISPTEDRIRVVAQAVKQLIEGRSNASGQITLTANAASTTITKTTINGQAGFFMFPKTANAAAEMAAGGCYAVVTAGSVVITHANNAQTDRTFYYVVIGG
jgi:hypothetical protein